MKKLNYIILLLLFPFILFGQENSEAKQKLEEVKAYVKIIDKTYKDAKEEIVKNPGVSEVYLINDVNNLPLRIRYATTEFDKNKELILYYRNGKLVSADLTINFTSGKNKTPYKRQFYFPESERLQWQSRTDAEEFKELENNYSFKYLFGEESLIREIVSK